MNTHVRCVVCDLDGTLAVSKQSLSHDIGDVLSRLLEVKRVGVISGGGFAQMKTQFLDHLPSGARRESLYILPMNGAELYEWMDGALQAVYRHTLSEDEDVRIRKALEKALEQSGFDEQATPRWGERIESRGSQVSFSALGQEAPVDEKLAWDPDRKKRLHIVSFLTPLLPDFEIHLGGVTTIDITKKGIDKAFGLRELSSHISIPLSDMVYVGDALFPGGNDEVVKKTGIHTIAVTSDKDVHDTLRVLEDLLKF